MHLKFVSKTLLLAIVSSSFTLTAFAQWQWIDKDGRKVFSDRAPSPEIQEKSIIKRPGATGQPISASSSEGPMAAPTRVASAPAGKTTVSALTGKDAQLEALKKKAVAEEEAKKKVEAEKTAKARADNCERAKRGLAIIESGVRISDANAKGERVVMDDSARGAEAKRLQGISDNECKN